MKITILNADNARVMQVLEPTGHIFDEVMTFLRYWNLDGDELAKVMKYVDAGKDLTLKCKFRLEWP